MNFLPADQLTVNLAVTGTAQSLTVGALPSGRTAVRIANIGTETVFLRWGGTATTAASMPMLANTVEVFDLPEGVTTLSAVAGTTGSTIYVTPGNGF